MKAKIYIPAPTLATTINISLEYGSQCQPTSNTLLKKTHLDPHSIKNYLPISNLSFVSKLLERCVPVQYHLYADDTELYAGFTGMQDGEASYAVDRVERCIKEARQ